MESSNLDVIETTINIDYQRKILLCWSNYPTTMKQWLADFPHQAVLAKDKSYVELNGLPLSAVKKLKLSKKPVLTEAQKETARLRGIELAKMRVKT